MQPIDIDDWEAFLEEQGCENIMDIGDWVMCNCIFHEQSDTVRPSLGIHKESGVGNCFGCGTHSWNDVCEVFGISVVEFIDGVRASVWDKFREKVLRKKTARKYKRYKLPKSLVNPLGHKGARKYLIEERNYDISVLEAYGIRLCRDSNSRYFNHVVFPIEDEKGVLFFDARYVGKTKGKTRWKRPKDSAYWKTYFNWENVKDSKTLLFVEGAGDALKLIQFGLPAIPAKNFSPYQLTMIRNAPVERIFLFYDNDEAGRTLLSEKGKPIHFTAKARHLFDNSGIEVITGIIPDYAGDPAQIESLSDIMKANPKLAKTFA